MDYDKEKNEASLTSKEQADLHDSTSSAVKKEEVNYKFLRYPVQRWLGILLTISVAIAFFLMGWAAVNMESLIIQNAESTDRIVQGIVIVAGGALIVSMFLMIISIVMKRFGAGLSNSLESLAEIAAIITAREDRVQELQTNVRKFVSGIKVFFLLLLLSFLTGIVVVLFQSLLTIANAMSHQQQILKMKEQNDLLTEQNISVQEQSQNMLAQNQIQVIQQQFEMSRVEADRSFKQIADILLNPDSSPQQQVYALSQVPRAMTHEVTLVAEPETQKALPQKAYAYPNIIRLRDILEQYLSVDRVERALRKANIVFVENAPLSKEALEILEEQGDVSTQLLITLHHLGTKVGDTAIWDISGGPAAKRMKFLKFQSQYDWLVDPKGKPHTLDFRHIRPEIWKGAQLPFAFNDFDFKVQLLFPLKADFRSAHFEGANLYSAHIEEANFSSAHLENADLSSAMLKGADFYAAHLEGADLRRALLEGAKLSYAKLEGADLSSANLQGAHIFGGRLEGADLSYANLRGAELSSAHLEGANLRYARLEGADLSCARLEGAELDRAHLEGASAWYANFAGADLRHAHLEGANFNGAGLEGVYLKHAQLAGTDLNEARLEGAEFATRFAEGTVEFSPVQIEPRGLREDSFVIADSWVGNYRAKLKAPIVSLPELPMRSLRYKGEWNRDVWVKLSDWFKMKYSESETPQPFVHALEKLLFSSSNSRLKSRIEVALRRFPFSIDDEQALKKIFGDESFESLFQPLTLITKPGYRLMQPDDHLIRAKFDMVWMRKSDRETLLRAIDEQQPEKEWDTAEFEELIVSLHAEASHNILLIPDGGYDFSLPDDLYATLGVLQFRFQEGTRMRLGEKEWLLALIENLQSESGQFESAFEKEKADFKDHIEEIVIPIPSDEESENDPKWRAWIERKLSVFQDEIQRAWDEEQTKVIEAMEK